MKKRLIELAFLLIIVTAGGCQPEPEYYDIRFMTLDPVAEDYIKYISHRRLRLASGQFGVEISCRNDHRTRNVAVDWRLLFYDRKRFQLEETEWNTVVFPPAQEMVLKGNSITTEAEDFVVQIRGSAL